ncbi:hypothetical protein [Dactylosporangium sp. CA-233914]|uniref:hypothetical protein n=1 Tax=Dactylosporangium sp. CA-233914 TaxID=3239934 RepID=UPI003D939BFF
MQSATIVLRTDSGEEGIMDRDELVAKETPPERPEPDRSCPPPLDPMPRFRRHRRAEHPEDAAHR